MDLLSPSYALFVLISVLLFHACPARLRPAYLALVSVLLYGYYSPVSAAILVGTALLVYGAARALEVQAKTSARRGALLFATMIVMLGYLLLIKMLPIFRQQGIAISAGHILLGLGVSYYTFKLMGYLIDVYWAKYPAWTDPFRFLAFAAFYPQLTAGPIQRANQFVLPAKGDEVSALMTAGLRRILLGVVKKTAIADQLGSILGYIDGLQPRHSDMLWIAAIVYALEMYVDFAALTDVAVGTAGIFGIRSPENFALPFFAPSISQFWRRWHMTLTFWLTDYVFTPLRMATRNLGNLGLILSITVNMVLIGLWHGIGWGFLFFGLAHSIFLVIDSLTATARRRFYRHHPAWDRITNALGPFFVFAMVAFALVLFRANSMHAIAYQLRHLWGGLLAPRASLIALADGYGRMRFGFTALCTSALLFFEFLGSGALPLPARLRSFTGLPLPFRWALYYAAIVVAVTLHQQSVHFIYAQF